MIWLQLCWYIRLPPSKVGGDNAWKPEARCRLLCACARPPPPFSPAPPFFRHLAAAVRGLRPTSPFLHARPQLSFSNCLQKEHKGRFRAVAHEQGSIVYWTYTINARPAPAASPPRRGPSLRRPPRCAVVAP